MSRVKMLKEGDDLAIMGWRGRRLLALVFLFVVANDLVEHHCEARVQGVRPAAQTRLFGQTEQPHEMSSPRSVSLVMLHRDHERSPLRNTQVQNLTFVQRMKEAAHRSSERTLALRSKVEMISGGVTNSSSTLNGLRKAKLLGVKSPVFSQQGEFLVDLNLGTPAQKFIAIVDTGSDLAWVQCKRCSNCIPDVPDPLFDPSQSSTYQLLPCVDDLCRSLPSTGLACKGRTCPFKYQYGDGTSTAGDFATDTVTFKSSWGDNTAAIPNFAFGCGTDNYGDLAGSDGVVGIGRGPFSLSSQLGFLAGTNIFSFCLVSIFDAPTKTSPLLIGANSFASASGSKWTPLIRNERTPFYYVHVDGIKVNGKPLRDVSSSSFAMDSSGRGGTIIDTGTTITELVPAAYDALLASVGAAMPFRTVDGNDYGFDLCWDISTAPGSWAGQQVFDFPAINFQFKWSNFTVPVESAYLQMDSAVTCLSFGSGDGMNIIGNVHLQNHHMFFNNDHGVLGWKPSQCDQS